jgi:hypothetical protein
MSASTGDDSNGELMYLATVEERGIDEAAGVASKKNESRKNRRRAARRGAAALAPLQ